MTGPNWRQASAGLLKLASPANLPEGLARRVQELRSRVNRDLVPDSATREATVQWLRLLSLAADRRDWPSLEHRLEERARYPIWMPEFREQVRELRQRLDEAQRLRHRYAGDLRQAEAQITKGDL